MTFDRLDAVGGLGHDADLVGQFEQRADTLAHQGLVVDQTDRNLGDAWSAAVIVSPPAAAMRPARNPGRAPVVMFRRPPICARRSRMPVRPLPWRNRSAPRPSSRACIASSFASVRSQTQPQIARSRVAHGIGDDFLRTAQQHLRAARIVDGKSRRQIKMDGQPGHAFDQGLATPRSDRWRRRRATG